MSPEYMKEKLFDVVKDIEYSVSEFNSPITYMAFISRDAQVVQCGGLTSTCTHRRHREEVIERDLSYLIVSKGIKYKSAEYNTLGPNFLKPEDIVRKKTQDYSFNEQILNFAYSTISLLNNTDELNEDEIIAVIYSEKTNSTIVERYSNPYRFDVAIYEKHNVQRRFGY